MIKYLEYIKAKLMKFYYLKLPFLSSNIKKKSFYKFVEDGSDDVLFRCLDLDSSAVVFDIGGFKGEFTDRIRTICQCRILIFEPVKAYYEIIKNKYSNIPLVYLYNFGLGSEKRNTTINIAGSSSTVYNNVSTQLDTQEIFIESINDFIKVNKIKTIHLMKINIEGGEYSLLESLISSHFIENIDILLIQFHDFVPDAIKLRNDIQNNLLLSHKKVFDYPFIWEKWVLV